MREDRLIETINAAMDEVSANLHTCAVAKVTAVQDKFISCQPVINRVVNNKSVRLPEFVEVPVITLQGGASYIAMPISIGDYCLLFFNERCFDGWYNGQDNINPVEMRMHNYSDGFAFVGVNPKAQAISNPSVMTFEGNAQQNGDYTHDGATEQTGNYTVTGDVNINGKYDQTGNFTLTGNMTITGNVIINGSLVVNGVIAGQGFAGIDGAPMSTTGSIIVTNGDVTADGVGLKTHVHGGVQTGGGTTGGPTG
jgi:phage baseplate assembly protein gpV